jgi:hypothetical protein
MQFPNEIQACLLIDQRVDSLETMVRAFLRIAEANLGARFNVPEANPGVFYRLFGGDELMITIEYLDKPASAEVFQQPLGSAITGIVCPDIRQRLIQSRSHILINVSHGALGNVLESSPEIAAMMRDIDYPMPGASLPQFTRRLAVCATIARIVGDHAPASVVHWTQSNQLFPGEAFDNLAAMEPPSPLHVHPFLYGHSMSEDGKAKLGIRTFGARHFIGRELLIEPSVIPWAANFETMLAFLRVATAEKGYLIPDGDTFGPEDRSLSYRVLHREAEAGDVPVIALQPLMYREFDFVAPDYVPPEKVFDDRMPPADLMPEDQDDKAALADEWREKRAMAEGIGGRFEVRSRGSGGAPPARPGGGCASRPVFGRKKA